MQRLLQDKCLLFLFSLLVLKNFKSLSVTSLPLKTLQNRLKLLKQKNVQSKVKLHLYNPIISYYIPIIYNPYNPSNPIRDGPFWGSSRMEYIPYYKSGFLNQHNCNFEMSEKLATPGLLKIKVI